MVTRNQHLDQRMNWFDRQFLRAQDFADESDYQVDRLRRHIRTLHTPGVAEGLVVRGQPGDNSVTIDPGTAIDDQGREIVLITQSSPLTLPSSTTAELYMSYTEAQTGPSQDPGISGYTRITEIPQFTFRETAPGSQPIPASGVLLATLSLSGGQLTSAPDITTQTKAGATVGDVTAFSVTLKRVGQPSVAWPRLTASGPNQLSLAGDLRLTSQGSAPGGLSLPGPLTLGGGPQLSGSGTNLLTLAGDLTLASQGTAQGALSLSGPLTLGSGLQFGTDPPITAISRDGTLGGNRTNAVPTEAAVKSYADGVRSYAAKNLGIQTGVAVFGSQGSQSCGFSVPFASPPQVFLAPIYLDVQPVRIDLSAGSVSTTQFTLNFRTWENSGVWQLTVQWLAFGPLA